jgi:ABC-type transport system substrate-binding protein
MKTTIGLAALILAGLCGAASAQTAQQNFSYKAPSGMFSEGTTKWGMYQFMESDAERMAKVRSGEGDVATGALSTSSSQSYPRPGERSTSPRRPTSR